MKLIDILVEELPKRGGWPEGSTRCMQTDGLYVTFPDIGDHCDFVAKCMAEGVRIATREQYEIELADSKPKWDGVGLPPVGCECEYETKFDGWQPVRIELIKSEGIAFTWLANSQAYNGLDCVGVQKSGSFRPIRSEAERKRDEAVKEFVRQLIECVDLHAMDKRNIDIVREKLYSMLPTLPGVTVID